MLTAFAAKGRPDIIKMLTECYIDELISNPLSKVKYNVTFLVIALNYNHLNTL